MLFGTVTLAAVQQVAWVSVLALKLSRYGGQTGHRAVCGGAGRVRDSQ